MIQLKVIVLRNVLAVHHSLWAPSLRRLLLISHNFMQLRREKAVFRVTCKTVPLPVSCNLFVMLKRNWPFKHTLPPAHRQISVGWRVRNLKLWFLHILNTGLLWCVEWFWSLNLVWGIILENIIIGSNRAYLSVVDPKSYFLGDLRLILLSKQCFKRLLIGALLFV